jgi:hypothetical protein
MFYTSLAKESVYRPEIECNPARTRWKLVRRKIADGSIFLFGQDLQLELSVESAHRPFRPPGQVGKDVDFFQVVSHAQQAIDREQNMHHHQQSPEIHRCQGP